MYFAVEDGGATAAADVAIARGNDRNVKFMMIP
jgi:hypothetical protein